MKKLLFFLFLFQSIVSHSQSISGEDTICGGTTEEYAILAMPIVFDHYSWSVVGGTFSNGLDHIIIEEKGDHDVDVTWNYDQQNVNAYVYCGIYYSEEHSNSNAILYVESASVSDLYGFDDEEDGNLYITVGNKTGYPIVALDAGWDNSYDWEFEPVGGTTESYGPTGLTLSLPLSALEYGELTVSSENTECNSTSEVSINIERKLATPEWDGGRSIMCTNSVYQFAIGEVDYATSYYWEPTGGFKVWDASNSSYVTTPVSTNNQRINVKAPSTNGAGSISITVKRLGSTVFDSETITRDIWSGIFSNPYVSGTAAVCHNSLYNYTAQVPYGSASSYSYSWQYPSGWYNYSQSNNTITLQTPTLASNMTYGTVRVSITNVCGASGYSGVTVYPGYNCGGYYMAAPNPASSYTDIDIASEEAKLLEASFKSDITISVVDKMGVPMFNANVESLPYRLNTSKFPNGEYVVQIISQAKEREIRVEALKIIVNH